MKLTVYKTDENFPTIYKTERGNNAINARDLHAKLEIKQAFAHWVKKKISQHKLQVNQDFVINAIKDKNKTEQRGRNLTEYILKMDSAKIIAMGTNNVQGDKIKNYFLECERELIAIKQRQSQPLPFEAHKSIDIQKQMSKAANGINFFEGSTPGVIEYNRENMLAVAGMYPNKLKEVAKERGLPSSHRTSGKEVLRHLAPAKACVLSVTDNLFGLGIKREAALKAALSTEPYFATLLQHGITPRELTV